MVDVTSDRSIEELVLIPGGEFLMGSDSEGDHRPVHKVYIDSFYIDRHEVTNAQYLAFCEATGHRLPDFWGMDGFRCGPDYPNYPVVTVSWHDAVEYAKWCGKRLPTEAEWEYAARGGLAGMNYPTGDTLDPSDGNYNQSGQGGPVAVGSYPANGFGLHDVQGNVVEWVRDFYDPDYYSSSPAANPPGPASGRFRVIRGGGWHSGAYCNSVYYRNALPPGWVDFNVGFRCVKDLESHDDPDAAGS
jgi:sulfatase modifying factor 1